MGKKVPDAIKNHPWNLKAVERSVHQQIHGNSPNKGDIYSVVEKWWYGTAAWAKGTEISIMTGIGGDLVTYGENE